jgi:hypothetical protein
MSDRKTQLTKDKKLDRLEEQMKKAVRAQVQLQVALTLRNLHLSVCNL